MEGWRDGWRRSRRRRGRKRRTLMCFKATTLISVEPRPGCWVPGAGPWLRPCPPHDDDQDGEGALRL